MTYFAVLSVLSIAVGIAITLRLERKYPDQNRRDLLATGFWATAIAGVVFIVGAVTGTVITFFIPLEEHTEITKTEPIVSIGDSSQLEGDLSGSFLHVEGSLTASLRYTFFVENESGGYEARILTETGQGAIEIFEFGPGEGTPRYEEHSLFSFYNVPDWVTWILPCHNTPMFVRVVKWKIHVPENTISTEMNLDLQ